jgi:hypothetical protein
LIIDDDVYRKEESSLELLVSLNGFFDYLFSDGARNVHDLVYTLSAVMASIPPPTTSLTDLLI